MPAQLAVIIHICSTKVPYASAGKEAIAEIPEIEEEMKLALRDAARKLRLYLSRKERELELLNKYVSLAKYVDEIAVSLSAITNVERSKIAASLYKLIENKLGTTAEEIAKYVASIAGNKE
ncbi:type II DNA topoisomerase VI, subunit B [Thermoproteus tenax Kra 1]|uniref:Type II DNA topoisomerase VI, subunit B n=1 Tax=Thermoproteus tenax (strain ATCC 35583 / DSM 2078 / JCM 9277 / NBRC 100435 / Kra 1) TaxID=768679 RepID=G4RPA5_THETK|nr:type II DNA topoisomerase VI, subunit B [Thermoproteus tenax Kra 1]